MPMLTTAADLFRHKPQEWYDLPVQLRELTEAAESARFTWEQLDDLLTKTFRNMPQDYHECRGAEQHAYLTWQAVEFAYQQIVKRMPVQLVAAASAV